MRSLKRALKRGNLRVLFNPLTMTLEMYRRTTRGKWQRTWFGRDNNSALSYDEHQLDNLDKKYLEWAEEIEEQRKKKQSEQAEEEIV